MASSFIEYGIKLLRFMWYIVLDEEMILISLK